MSGPKCVDIYVDPRVAEREKNRAQCEILTAEYMRLEVRLRHLAPEAQKIGIMMPPVVCKTEIDDEIARYLSNDGDREALAYLREQAERLRRTVSELEQELNDTHVRMLTNKLHSHAGSITSLDELLASLQKDAVPDTHGDSIGKKLDAMLAKMAVLRDSTGWAVLVERANEIRGEPDPVRREMLCDDFRIRCSEQVKYFRELAAWTASIDQLIDSAAHVREFDTIAAIVRELEELKRSRTVIPLEAIRDRLKETVEAQERRLERERKRHAILGSLKELGYETNEGMATAFVQAGRLIIQKPGENEYAVELVTNDDLTLLQTAMLRYAAAADASTQQTLRDKAKEEVWCHDHAKFLEGLARRGLRTNFKFRLRPGQVPMRVVIDEKKAKARRRTAVALARSQTADRKRNG